MKHIFWAGIIFLAVFSLRMPLLAQTPEGIQEAAAGPYTITLQYEPQQLSAQVRTLFIVDMKNKEGGMPVSFSSVNVRWEASTGEAISVAEVAPSGNGSAQFEFAVPKESEYMLRLSFKFTESESANVSFPLVFGPFDGSKARAPAASRDPLLGLIEHPWAFAAIVAWSLMWKGLALWRAGQLRQKGWFVALLLMNTMGLVEIAYLAFTQQKVRGQGNHT